MQANVNDSSKKTQALSISLPLSLLRSGQILALTPDSKGGLILQKGFYSDWIPPGALVGGYYDIDCTRVYVAGKIRFYAPETHQSRTKALQTRMGQISQLQTIISDPSSFRRAYKILRHLSKWLSYRDMRQIPHELIAQLVGVNPSTVKLFWNRYLSAVQHRRDGTTASPETDTDAVTTSILI
ncbi:hypothetical protein AY599_12160 [Leptolyngbya valderiana BDU 20041]|nr:hypothetical protein [Geitlerinema sp. CS-897]OAB55489.1 hypothetical protein AY599_12160 [Leptolyngbya valderiana BDU 20041]PPT04952.1 hypothetical protein CKA32_005611 [Geitlerinema sp. FC II]